MEKKEMAKNLAVTPAASILAVVSAQALTATGIIQGTVKDNTGSLWRKYIRTAR